MLGMQRVISMTLTCLRFQLYCIQKYRHVPKIPNLETSFPELCYPFSLSLILNNFLGSAQFAQFRDTDHCSSYCPTISLVWWHYLATTCRSYDTFHISLFHCVIDTTRQVNGQHSYAKSLGKFTGLIPLRQNSRVKIVRRRHLRNKILFYSLYLVWEMSMFLSNGFCPRATIRAPIHSGF